MELPIYPARSGVDPDNKQQLKNALNSIGKKVFLDYFPSFLAISDIEQEIAELAERIKEDRDYATLDTTVRRVKNARNIIKSGLVKDALSDISKSEGVGREYREKARRLAATF